MRGAGPLASMSRTSAAILARSRGATIVEAYPAEYRGDVADAWVYTGAASTFVDLGWEEVARRSKSRPIVRKVVARGGRRG